MDEICELLAGGPALPLAAGLAGGQGEGRKPREKREQENTSLPLT